MAGTKHDAGKTRMTLVPLLASTEIARVMTHGAEEYAPYNWYAGIAMSRLLDAAERHIAAFKAGESTEADGLHHLAKACCELMFAMTFDIEGRAEWDDRPVLTAGEQQAILSRLRMPAPDELEFAPSRQIGG